jgi:hypothetical protein
MYKEYNEKTLINFLTSAISHKSHSQQLFIIDQVMDNILNKAADNFEQDEKIEKENGQSSKEQADL